MAQIIEENIVIKLSEIAKDGAYEPITYINDELLSTIETIVQELVPSGIVVEVVRA